MKKIFIFALIFVTFFCVASAYAEENSSMTFDNVTFGKAYKIKGYASIKLLGFKFVNIYAQWEDGKAGTDHEVPYFNTTDAVYYQKPKKLNVLTGKENNAYKNCYFIESGNEAEFAWLKVDVINLQKTPANFVKDITVKVIYDDEYEFNGWVRQFNYDYSKSEIYRFKETTVIGWPVCLSPADETSIGSMYDGHYVFGCTVPNHAINDKTAPLRMEITMGDHKLTYNIH